MILVTVTRSQKAKTWNAVYKNSRNRHAENAVQCFSHCNHKYSYSVSSDIWPVKTRPRYDVQYVWRDVKLYSTKPRPPACPQFDYWLIILINNCLKLSGIWVRNNQSLVDLVHKWSECFVLPRYHSVRTFPRNSAMQHWCKIFRKLLRIFLVFYTEYNRQFNCCLLYTSPSPRD